MRILSGVFTDEDGQQVTTGTPISLLIDNVDQRGQDYDDIKDKFRPGHADFTYWEKYGVRDYRGGGRASARETAMRVAAGAIARRVHPRGEHPRRAGAGRPAQDRPRPLVLGRGREEPVLLARPRHRRDLDRATSTRCARPARRSGAVIEVVAEGVPAGLGAPIYGKLDQDLAGGDDEHQRRQGRRDRRRHGRRRELTGEDNADEMRLGNDGRPVFLSNNAGGILGGISSGQPVVARFAVKPTSSILTPRRTIDRFGQRDRDCHQGPPRPLRRHPRRAGGRGDDGHSCSPTICCATAGQVGVSG